jgi:SAM-dependent methyltransferase
MPAATTKTPIFDRLSVLNDPIRCRSLLVLERQELTVSELCTVLQLPQSTASRHLKVLSDDGWTVARRDGTSRRYAMPMADLETDARRLWALIREHLLDTPAAVQDRQRLEGVLAARRTRSQEFFSTTAGAWAQLRREMFGPSFDLHGLLGLLDDRRQVADLGCGTGQVTEYLAPFVDRVIAVDDSPAMLEAARMRLAAVANAEVRQGQLEALPIEDGAMDAATLVLVLHHLPEPARALAEAARILRPGGRLLILDMLPHDREEYRQSMGHVWLGFSEEQLNRWLAAAGFHPARVRPLPAAPEARGPMLFAATAGRSTSPAPSVQAVSQVVNQAGTPARQREKATL